MSLGRIFSLHKNNNKGSSSRNQDEKLARSLQENVNISQPERNCYKCGRGIDKKDYFYCKDKHWHLSCLPCDACHRFIHKNKYLTIEDDIYHESCYNSKHTNWRKCSVCCKIINYTDQIFQHPFWNQTYCRLHTFDGTPQCSICERYQEKEEQHIKLGDGRSLCKDCHWTAIFDVDQLKSLKNYLLHFFKINQVKFENNTPIFMVDMNDITNLASLRQTGQPILSELTISRATRHRPNLSVNVVKSCKLNGAEMTVQKKTTELSPPWILIPYGLPWLVAGELLAQEMMHIWMQSNEDYKDFNSSIKEGICRAMAYRCLHDQKTDPVGNARKVEFMKMLREFRKIKFKDQQSSIYGHGFVGARTVIQKFGVKIALERISLKTYKGRKNVTIIDEDDLELDEYD